MAEEIEEAEGTPASAAVGRWIGGVWTGSEEGEADIEDVKAAEDKDKEDEENEESDGPR